MSKKKIENLVTNINETEELNAVFEECPKHLLGKFQRTLLTLYAPTLTNPSLLVKYSHRSL